MELQMNDCLFGVGSGCSFQEKICRPISIMSPLKENIQDIRQQVQYTNGTAATNCRVA
jgi:hypothetical protein